MKRNPKRNFKQTPPRKSPRKVSMLSQNTIKRLRKMKPYDSPLKHFQKKGKRQLLGEDLTLIQPIKRQKLNCRRDSVIIINEENDFDSPRATRSRTAKAKNVKNHNTSEKSKRLESRIKKSKEIVNDSIIIIEDENQPSAENLNQTDDVMVLWSSVPDSPKQRNQIQNSPGSVPFSVDNTPTFSNLEILRGDYPQKWLGDWLSKTNKTKTKLKNKSPNVKKSQGNKMNERIEKQKIFEIAKNQKEVSEKESVPGKLREIIVDGCNIAKAYSKGKFFSEQGIKLVIDFFKEKGHTVKVFVPQHVRNRKRNILEKLHREGFIIFTPSRKAGSKSITPYEDRYILEYATKCDGIVVSNDQFKDLYEEKPEWRETIEKRILPATFVGDHLMFPEDPLGRHGPKLDKFLRHDT